MATKDICTVEQLDNSTDITNIIIDESGNLRKVNLKKAVNNFTPPQEKIEQIQQNTNDIAWIRGDISDLKTQVSSLSEENTELKSDLDDITEGKTETRYLCKSKDKYLVYYSSTFSGWMTKWTVDENTIIRDFTFAIKGRTDITKNVTQVRVRIAVGECKDSNVVYDNIINTSIDSALGEEKEITVNVGKVRVSKDSTIYIVLQADATCGFYFSSMDTDETKPYGYSTSGHMGSSMEDFVVTGAGAYRLWIKCTRAIYFPKIADGSVTTKKIADGSVTLDKQNIISVEVGENIFDINTHIVATQTWWWTNNNKVKLESNQYTGTMNAIKIPVDDSNSYLTISSKKSSIKIMSWFMVGDDEETIITSQGDSAINVGIVTPFTIEIPTGAKYLCITFTNIVLTDEIMVNYGNESLPYKDYVENIYIKSNKMLNINDVKELISGEPYKLLKLPRQFNLIVDDTFEMFYKGISNCIDSNIYDYELTFADYVSRGKAWKRKWEWTPTSSDVGTKVLNITVRDNLGNLIDSDSVNIIVSEKPTSPLSEKVVLCVGDSLTTGGTWCSELRRRLIATDGSPVGYGLNNIKFIGTKANADGCKYEGYGGWTFSSYLSSMKTNEFMNINGTFDKEDVDQHSIYSDSNGTQWKLETITSNVIKIIRVSGSTTLPSSGTLTWVSGGENHSDIVYTSSEQASGNPFWNDTTGQVDFTSYMAKMGITQIDYMYILLGWNSTGSTEESYKAVVREFIDKVLAEIPNCKITLMGLQVPSRNGFANNYGISWKYYEKLQHVWNLNEWYQDIADEYDNVEFINISGQFDTDYNHLETSFVVNTRNSKKETLQSNGVHPAKSGYYQIADGVLRKLVTNI